MMEGLGNPVVAVQKRPMQACAAFDSMAETKISRFSSLARGTLLLLRV
jgi:hypothetical protein